MGNPAKQMGWVCACNQRLEFDQGKATCAACGKEYSLIEDKVLEL